MRRQTLIIVALTFCTVLYGGRWSETGSLVYGRKGFNIDSLGKRDGEELTCDFFNLRDLWTDPHSSHFNDLVNQFAEIYFFYISELGVDGLRIDTVRHVHKRFWDKFTEILRNRLGAKASSLIMFGEVYDGSPKSLGNWTFRNESTE